MKFISDLMLRIAWRQQNGHRRNKQFDTNRFIPNRSCSEWLYLRFVCVCVCCPLLTLPVDSSPLPLSFMPGSERSNEILHGLCKKIWPVFLQLRAAAWDEQGDPSRTHKACFTNAQISRLQTYFTFLLWQSTPSSIVLFRNYSMKTLNLTDCRQESLDGG
jgi:hypothetical protein